MVRLSLALVLALGSHVFFLCIVLPVQRDELPSVPGIRQVTVHMVHPASDQAEEMEEAAQVPEPETEWEEKEVIAEIVEPGHVEEMVPDTTLLREPEERKKSAPSEPAKVKAGSEKKDVGKGGGHNENRGLKTTEVRPPQSDGSEASPGQTESAHVQQAMVLYEINQPPAYPALARRRDWEGTVVLAVEVESDGLVKSVRVQTSSSYSLLDDAALETVKKWQFKPGTRGGRPVAMEVLVPVHFLLKDRS